MKTLEDTDVDPDIATVVIFNKPEYLGEIVTLKTNLEFILTLLLYEKTKNQGGLVNVTPVCPTKLKELSFMNLI